MTSTETPRSVVTKIPELKSWLSPAAVFVVAIASIVGGKFEHNKDTKQLEALENIPATAANWDKIAWHYGHERSYREALLAAAELESISPVRAIQTFTAMADQLCKAANPAPCKEPFIAEALDAAIQMETQDPSTKPVAIRFLQSVADKTNVGENPSLDEVIFKAAITLDDSQVAAKFLPTLTASDPEGGVKLMFDKWATARLQTPAQPGPGT